MPIVGSFAGASARAFGLGATSAPPIGDFESIATVTVSTAVANIEFTSIPATFTHLQIRCIARMSGVTAADNMRLTFNSDTSALYANHLLIGAGNANPSSGVDINGTFAYISSTVGASTPANIFDASVMDILDYANTNKFKTIRNLNGSDRSNSSGNAVLWSGLYRSTNAITSIKLTPGVGNFVQYCSFALYGVKA